MEPTEFYINSVVADIGVQEGRRSYFETLADLVSQFLKAIFGKRNNRSR